MVLVLVSGSFQTMDTPHKADTFGQQVDLPEDLARSVILAGASLLPKDAFDACGFSAKEIEEYPNSRMQANAPLTFHTKHAKALQAVRDYRAGLLTPDTAKPAGVSADARGKQSSSSEVKS